MNEVEAYEHCKEFINENYIPVKDKPGYVWFSRRSMQIINIETFAKSLAEGLARGLYNLPLAEKRRKRKMKYEFVLTEQMENDRKNCSEDSRCLECSCHMGEDDCVFNHLYVTAEQEHDIEEDTI